MTVSEWCGENALHVAIRYGQPGTVRFLLDCFADVTEQSLESPVGFGTPTRFHRKLPIRSCLGLAFRGTNGYLTGPEEPWHARRTFVEIVQLLTKNHD